MLKFIERLKSQGIYLSISEGKLVCKAQKGAMTPAKMEEIKRHKSSLLQTLLPMSKEWLNGIDACNDDLLLSENQKRMWLVSQMEEKQSQYNILGGIEVVGELDLIALDHAIKTVIDNNRVLLTKYIEDKGHVTGVVSKENSFKLEHKVLSFLNAEDKAWRVSAISEEMGARAFDMSTELPIDVKVIELGRSTFNILVSVHHIASDGWSTGILLNQIIDAYNCSIEGKDYAPYQGPDYYDINSWLSQWFKSDVLEDHVNFWRKRLDGAPESHGFPLKASRGDIQPCRERRVIEKKYHQQIISIARENQVSPLNVYYSLFAMIVMRLTNTDDVVIGMPSAGRPHPDMLGAMGYFASTLPIRTSTSSNEKTLKEFIKEQAQNIKECFQYESLPFNKIVENTLQSRVSDLPPVFQIMFSTEENQDRALLPNLKGAQISPLDLHKNSSIFDIELDVKDKGHALEYVWSYNKAIIDDRIIDSLDKNWLALLSNVQELLDTKLSDINLTELPDDIHYFEVVESENTDDELGDFRKLKGESRLPVGTVENTVAKIFSDILNVPLSKIMVSESFFDLGGQSLMAARLKARISDELNTDVEYGDIFNAPSVEAIAHRMVSKLFVRLPSEKREEVARKLGVEGSVNSGILELIDNPENHENLINTVNGYIDNKEVASQATVVIPKVAEQSSYPLSTSQLQHVLTHELAGGNSGSVISQAIVLNNPLVPKVLKQAIECVRSRHDSLRTSIVNIDGQYRQVVGGFDDSVFTYKELLQYDIESDSVRAVVEDFASQPVDLSAQLIKVLLIGGRDEKQLLYIGMHHSISDGVSMDVFVDELLHAYKLGGDIKAFNASLPQLSYQYKDLASWQENLDIENHPHGAYWRDVFSSPIEPLSLPNDKNRGAYRTFSGSLIDHQLTEQVKNSVDTLAKQCQTSEFVILLSAVNALLYKFTGQNVIPVGIPSSGRDYLPDEPQIGCYVNMLPIVNRMPKDSSFRSLIDSIKNNVSGAKQNELYPYSSMAQQFSKDSDKNRNPLFDVIMTFDDSEKQLDDSQGSAYYLNASDNTNADQDLAFAFYSNGKELSLNLIYNKELYSKERARDIISLFESLLLEMCQNLNTPVRQLSESVKKSYPAYKFSEKPSTSVAQDLMSIDEEMLNFNAIEEAGCSVTYSELRERALSLSAFVKSKYKINKDSRVIVDSVSCIERVVAYYAVWFAGAAVIPVDPATEVGRKEIISEASQASLVISDYDPIGYSQNLEKSSSFHENVSLFTPDLTLHSNAYVIFTSGSTGKPKGVIVSHANLAAYTKDALTTYGKGGLRALQYLSPSFDSSFHELVRSIFTGGTLVSAGYDLKMSPEKLWDFVIDNQIESIVMTTGLFSGSLHAISEEQGRRISSTLKELVFGGEQVQSQTVQQWFSIVGNKVKLHNGYGPTEATIISLNQCLNDITPTNHIPIGKPQPSESVYVISEDGQRLAFGSKGYLVIEGEGVSKGYIDTSLNGSFLSQKSYSTGDIVRANPNGEYIYCGRSDNQIKVRGVRLEKGEIESALLSYSGISDAKVALVDKKLVGWVISDISSIDTNSVMSHVGSKISPQAVPHILIVLPKWPLTPNGKIDTVILMDEIKLVEREHSPYVSPKTDDQKEMVNIWTSVLRNENIGINDNFFELDGDSLAAINIVSIAKSRGLTVTTKDIFEKQTIEEILRHRDKNQTLSEIKEAQSNGFDNYDDDDEEFIL